MTTLICNLTRFGDLIQTQPVIHGLSDRGQRVGLLCLENFAAATPLLSDLDYAAPLPGSTLLAALQRGDWPDALARTRAFQEHTAAAFPYDTVLNLTASMAVRLLTRLLELAPGRRIRASHGFLLDDHGFQASGGPWAAFLLASAQRRGLSPFNLVDIFWKVAGLPDEPRRFTLQKPPEAARAAVDALLTRYAAGPATPQRYVALQLGASEERRRWPVEAFAEAAAGLARSGVTPVLCGSAKETHLGERFLALYREALAGRLREAPCVNAIGATGLQELAALVGRCELLITNDTGTMHLAAGLGVPVLAIFLATAQPWDTSPYSMGACCLEPAMACHPCAYGQTCPHGPGEEPCRRAIHPGTVLALAQSLLQTGRWTPQPEAPGWRDARVWRTRAGVAHFMDLEAVDPAAGLEAQDRTLWLRAQRSVLRRFLDEALHPPESEVGTPTPLSAPRETLEAIRRELPGDALAALSPERRDVLRQELEHSEQLLTLLMEQGRALAATSATPLKRKFLGGVQRLQALWSQSDFLGGLGYLWGVASQEQRALDEALLLAARYQQCIRTLRALLAP